MSERPAPESTALTVNAGSSSLRLASYVLGETPRCVAEAHYAPAPVPDAAVVTAFLAEQSLPSPAIAMHRVVHGGPRLRGPCAITADVEAEIARLKTLAPLHNGVALDWIGASRAALGANVVQAACFDTAFYADLPAVAAQYALPVDLTDRHHVRRYGFHGLAHQSMLDRWRNESHTDGDRRVISLQLGGGCSMTATDHGWPIETSMGFSPLDGLMMATRCGDLDPAAVLYLVEEGGFEPAELSWILNESSGLRGVSGQSADMKTLLESETDDAALAVAMFCHRVRHYLGAYLVALGGADAILFGGGIGEQAPEIRARVLDHLDWAGIRLDTARNAAISTTDGGRIHSDDSRVEIWVTPTDEEGVMARAAHELLTQLAASTTTEDRP